MKAREIKKAMLKEYQEAISEYDRARVRLEAQHNKIREIEINLKGYFNINITYNFE